MLNWLERLLFWEHATPGSWYMNYHAAWDAAHPQAWVNGTGKAGSFLKGNVWVTGTPEWDKGWFDRHGMKPPRRIQVADMSLKPGEIRIAPVLAPEESASIRIKFGEQR